MGKFLFAFLNAAVEVLIAQLKKARYRQWRQGYEDKLQTRVDRARGGDGNTPAPK